MFHPTALIEPGATIGPQTQIGAFVRVRPGAIIGCDCQIHDRVGIENKVIIGNRVTIKSGVHLWDGLTLEDDSFIGPNVAFSDEPDKTTLIRHGASIGANTTILAGITIGQHARIEAGSLVHKNVPAYAIVSGHPARVHGYVAAGDHSPFSELQPSQNPSQPKVAGVQIYHLPIYTDLRGSLSVAEYDKSLPFIAKRYFISFDVPSKEVRGEHAHKAQHQFLVCVNGTCAVVVDDGVNREEILLDQPNVGIHIGPMVWATQYKYTPEAVLLVLASDVYEPEDYIRDYDNFLKIARFSLEDK